MSDMENVIASLSLIGISRKGKEEPIEIIISKPFPDDNCWICPLTVSLATKPMKIHGADSMQALAMAFFMVRFYLVDFVQWGGQLLDPEERKPFPLDAYFPKKDPGSGTNS